MYKIKFLVFRRLERTLIGYSKPRPRYKHLQIHAAALRATPRHNTSHHITRDISRAPRHDTTLVQESFKLHRNNIISFCLLDAIYNLQTNVCSPRRACARAAVFTDRI